MSTKCPFLHIQIETIGDCYVAVTGLPNPQEHHAIIMAHFAADCMLALNNLMPLLVAKLGPDTRNLTMRFGLHSGPVTAGVLRGARARFQLFGYVPIYMRLSNILPIYLLPYIAFNNFAVTRLILLRGWNPQDKRVGFK